MKTNKRTTILIAVCIAIIAFVGGTIAAFRASTGTKEDVTTATLGVTIVQTADSDQASQVQFDAKGNFAGLTYATAAPGAIIQEEVAVKNTDQKPCYLSVRINRSWIDEEGIKDFTLDPEEIIINQNNTAWLIQTDPNDSEYLQFYYKQILEPGETTANVMDSFELLTHQLNQNSNAYANMSSQITLTANAIQTTAASDAMLAEWGIKPTFDPSTGDLIGYSEQ